MYRWAYILSGSYASNKKCSERLMVSWTIGLIFTWLEVYVNFEIILFYDTQINKYVKLSWIALNNFQQHVNNFNKQRHLGSHFCWQRYIYIYYLFLIYLKLTTQAVHIYTKKIAKLLKIVSMLINVNWKIIKNDQIKNAYCHVSRLSTLNCFPDRDRKG